jgi:hypothetical protein
LAIERSRARVSALTSIKSFRNRGLAALFPGRMPRYFFHLHNDEDTLDEEGRELPDIDAARREARADARHMAAESVSSTGRLDRSHFVAVTRADGKLLFRVTFGEAVAIVG